MDTGTVTLDYMVNKAFEGRYFMGHTPVLPLSSVVWGALMNPVDSPVNFYVNVFTVTNYSAVPFQSQVWLNAPLENASESPNVSPSNIAKRPLREPNTRLLYSGSSGQPSSGVSLFSRIAQPNMTVVADYSGEIIVPPGSSFAVYLFSPGTQKINTELAFGWWEEYI